MRLVPFAAAFVLLAPVPLGGAAQAAERIDGRWKGAYECGQGKTELTLILNSHGGGNLTGDFQFRYGDVYGSYRLTGTITPQGELKLNPTVWITRPAGHEMVGLTGRAYDRSGEGKPDALYGDVTDNRCGKFAAEKQ